MNEKEQKMNEKSKKLDSFSEGPSKWSFKALHQVSLIFQKNNLKMSRAELLITLCYEIPCTMSFLKRIKVFALFHSFSALFHSFSDFWTFPTEGDDFYKFSISI